MLKNESENVGGFPGSTESEIVDCCAMTDLLLDWVKTVSYMKENPGTAVTFAVVGLASGAVLLLLFLIVRAVLRNRRRDAASLADSTDKEPPKKSPTATGGLIIGVSGAPKDSFALPHYDPAVDSSEQVRLLPQSPSVANSLSSPAVKSQASTVSFADDVMIPSEAPLYQQARRTRLQYNDTTSNDGIINSPTSPTSPNSISTSMNDDVFLPTPINRNGPAAVDVSVLFDDVTDDYRQPFVRGEDAGRGSFYSNPYRHDTIDARVRRSRVK